MLRRALMLKVVSWIVLSPPFAMTQLYVNSVSKAGPQQDTIVQTFRFVQSTPDSTCKAWLTGINDTIAELLGDPAKPETVLVAHGDMRDGKNKSTLAAFTGNVNGIGLPVGIIMTFNNDSAFYIDNGRKIGGFRGGTAEARTLVVLHEFGHLLSAPGFEDDADNNVSNAAKVESNNDRVKAHCGELLKAAKKHK